MKPNCPNCNSLVKKEDLVPNFVIAEVISTQKAKHAKMEVEEGERDEKQPGQLLKGGSLTILN